MEPRRGTADSTLYLTNTLARAKEPFTPREENRVKVFTCGPSIYRRPHIGNYRTFLYEDILQRYLEYRGHRVERLINFTDVEDKAVAEARQRGMGLAELTEPVAKQFLKEAELLHIKLPDTIPRSSTTVDQAVKLIRILLEKGYAYWHGRDVFYDPLTFPEFGKLFGLDMTRWPRSKRRFRKDTYPGQRWNLGDFILWHGYRAGQEHTCCWETEIGKGRPSWNIQDPAAISRHLGYEIDISCGGVDNLYRHHDYNIAVMEAVSGALFARYWLHGEHVLVDGSKMSKSKGNIVYLETLLAEGYSAQHIRFYLMYGHYRKRLNLTAKALRKACRKLESLRNRARELDGPDPEIQGSRGSSAPGGAGLIAGFEEHMNDDLNVEGAIDTVDENLADLVELKRNGELGREDCRRIRDALRRIDGVLKVLGDLPG
jgi:cysteinyl-tRNA synthetase